MPTTAPADIGIAAAYPGDKNIASDPAVIFADDFESYTSPDQAIAKWGEAAATYAYCGSRPRRTTYFLAANQ